MTQGFWCDLRVAVRRLLATPLFLIFAVLSLAIGLSVTVVAYALIDATIWRHTGMADPGRVVVVTVPVIGPRGPLPERTWTRAISRADFDEIAAAQHVFSSLAALQGGSGVMVGDATTATLRTEAVTGGYFAVAAVPALLGRTIGDSDVRASATVVVLSELLWRTRFSARSDIVGHPVRFDGRQFDVIGVMPATFRGSAIGLPPDAWIPLTAAGNSRDASGNDRVLSVFGRLAPGRAIEHAATEIEAIAQRLDVARPIRAPAFGPADDRTISRSWSATAIDNQDPLGRRIGWILVLLVAVVLVVACTNLANLMMARGSLRQQELAIRRALGGGRSRLIREFLVESLVIAALGALAAMLLTRVLVLVMPSEVATNAGLVSITPVFSLRLLIGAVTALLVSMLGFGVEPAMQLTRPSVSVDLSTGATMAGVARSRRQRWLIGLQVAFCTGFFAVTAVATRVAIDSTRHDSGIDLDHLAVAVATQPPEWEVARLRDAAETAVQAMQGRGGVQRTAVTTGTPFGTPGRIARVTTPDQPLREDVPNINNAAFLIGATPGVFDVFGVPLLSGRRFDARDDAGGRDVAIINASMARRLFGVSNAIDREIVVRERRQDARTLRVIGVARDTDTVDVYMRQLGTVWVPLAQMPPSPEVFLVARADDPAAAAQTLQLSLHQADPDIGVSYAGAGSVLLASAFVLARVAAALALSLGGIAMFLAMVGLFGLQSQMAARRVRETGIRMALGATVREIRQLIIREGMRPVTAGVLAGLAISVLVRLALRATLPAAVTAVDPIVLVVVPLPLAIAAYIACRIPASRAARVDPNVALRQL